MKVKARKRSKIRPRKQRNLQERSLQRRKLISKRKKR